MTKTEATNKFVTEYLASAKICCDKCFAIAIDNQSWIARAFSEGWDACSVDITGAPDSRQGPKNE